MARKTPEDTIPLRERQLTARPDLLDFRDLMYAPTLVEVPSRRDLADYRKARVPILDQGREGACTGFGLATVVHYLLRTRRRVPEARAVSPYMLYELARRYDEWPGEDYEGSSCRGAMKGWHKHGACDLDLWPAADGGALSEALVNNAAQRPLGAYFRVNHRDLVAMHAAIAEVGILYVSGNIHSGWGAVGKDGEIAFAEDTLGGHAYAIVAYDERGFWLQNSWGKRWGYQGFGHIGYQDWLKHGTDAWVARLAVPIELPTRSSTGAQVFGGAPRARAWSFNELRPHVISLGNEGRLQPGGDIGTSPQQVREIVRSDIPRITAGWKKKRIVLFAHGGLVNEETALQRIAAYRKPMLETECFPLTFVWHSDAWSTLAALAATDASCEFHIVGHSAGSILHAPLLQYLTGKGSIAGGPMAGQQGLGLPVASATLWAPAISLALFKESWLPALPAIARFALFTLDDATEQNDHCAGIYHKSLLYLISNAFEESWRIPLLRPDGEPILGLQKFVDQDAVLQALFAAGRADWILAPNEAPADSAAASRARAHGDFDDDPATVQATLARILGTATTTATLAFASSGQHRRAVRKKLEQARR